MSQPDLVDFFTNLISHDTTLLVMSYIGWLDSFCPCIREGFN